MYTALLLDSSCLSRYSARFDCGCIYELTVRLLSNDYIVLEEFHPEPVIIEQWSDAKWREVSSSPGGSSFKQCYGICVLQVLLGLKCQ